MWAALLRNLTKTEANMTLEELIRWRRQEERLIHGEDPDSGEDSASAEEESSEEGDVPPEREDPPERSDPPEREPVSQQDVAYIIRAILYRIWRKKIRCVAKSRGPVFRSGLRLEIKPHVTLKRWQHTMSKISCVACSCRDDMSCKTRACPQPFWLLFWAQVVFQGKNVTRVCCTRLVTRTEANTPEPCYRAVLHIKNRLLGANLFLDKGVYANMPLRIISLDFATAFEKVKSDAVWEVLGTDGISDHLIWPAFFPTFISPNPAMYWAIKADFFFCIKRGVQQGLV